MKKKKIALYISGFYLGGIEEFITNVASQMNKSKYHVIILTRFADVNSEAYKKAVNLNIEIINLNIQHLGLNNFILFKKKLDLFFNEQKIDILHVNGGDEPILFRTARRNGIRIIMHVHEPRNECNNRIIRFIKKQIEYENVKMAHEFFACSESTSKVFFEKYDINNVHVISNGINNDSFKFESKIREEVRKQLGFNGIIIGNVGRLTEVKNQMYLLQIMKALQEKEQYTLAIIGQGEDEKKLIKFVEENNLRDRVVFLGERGDVARILQALDIFLMPSKFEGLGIALLEAQAAGLKCIISDSIPDEAIETNLVTKLPTDLETLKEWVNAITNLDLSYDRTPYAEVMSNTKYDIKYTCKQLEKYYE